MPGQRGNTAVSSFAMRYMAVISRIFGVASAGAHVRMSGYNTLDSKTLCEQTPIALVIVCGAQQGRDCKPTNLHPFIHDRSDRPARRRVLRA